MDPIRVILVGAGDRGNGYCRYTLKNPEKMQVVGVVEPNDFRRRKAVDTYNIKQNYVFKSIDELIRVEKFADAVINATMDHQHVETAIPTLNKGYDLLMEKPFAVNKNQVKVLTQVAEKNKRKVMICHVLRYAPFYREIKKVLLEQDLGEIISIHTYEHVSFHHMAVSYVKGKWRNKESCYAPILLAKCCHDLDLIMWFNNKAAPTAISSFGGRHFFTKENKPCNAGSRCLLDCDIEKECIYSAKKHYIDKPDRWKQYVWTHIEHLDNPTIEDKIQSLKTDNPFGKCVWDMDNNVNDRQTVSIQFENGSIATHNLIGGASRGERGIHIVCSKGEVLGTFQDSIFKIRKTNPTESKDYDEQTIDLNITGDMDGAYGAHGGGDQRLVADFVNFIGGNETSISLTSLQDSANSHLAAFYAEEALKSHSAKLFE